MISISQIKLPVDHRTEDLERKVCKALRISPARLIDTQILRRSVDARDKGNIHYVYQVAAKVQNEESALFAVSDRRISKLEKKPYRFPADGRMSLEQRPVIIGAGPAGLFCAYELSRAGFRPIVIERGETAQKRKEKIDSFWNTGKLDPESNVQFGEGGAGTFSDGKLNSGISNENSRKDEVFRIFIEAGAEPSIAYDAAPHIGTDRLLTIIPAIRQKCIENGATFRFGTRLEDLILKNGSLSALKLEGEEILPAQICILAIGHSARDTIGMLHKNGLTMEKKNFAVGFRVQHEQELINRSQWGEDYPVALGAAPYKLSAHMEDGRGVFSFCMCPGGTILNASSEEGCLAVNGMSNAARDSGFANSAIVVSVTPEDFGSNDVLSGIAFQRQLERKAFEAGNGKIPCMHFSDFENRILRSTPESALFQTGGASKYADITNILPDALNSDLVRGMHLFEKKIKGFAASDPCMFAVESRTSSPVRITRNEEFESCIKGIYPCGEGAGYAGGIMSAAVDGIRIAEAVARQYKPF